MLLRELPSRFTSTIAETLKDLPAIFHPTYLLVLTHADLCEMNVIVNPERGRITGIVDWIDAKVLPFGMSGWAIRNFLGSWIRIVGTAYKMHPGSKGFLGNLRTGRREDVRARTGWTDPSDGGVLERSVREYNSSMRYLDAFLPGLRVRDDCFGVF